MTLKSVAHERGWRGGVEIEASYIHAQNTGLYLLDYRKLMGFGLQFYEFLFRFVANLVRRGMCTRWQPYSAIVAKSEIHNAISGCIIVSVHYRYRNSENRFEGIHRQPFIFENYAEAYLRRYPGGSEFPVLVDPAHLNRSVPKQWKVKFVRVK